MHFRDCTRQGCNRASHLADMITHFRVLIGKFGYLFGLLGRHLLDLAVRPFSNLLNLSSGFGGQITKLFVSFYSKLLKPFRITDLHVKNVPF